jgi:aldehyde dehydrogenase (NAD+)
MPPAQQNELYIGGEWRSSLGSSRLRVINPSTEDLVGECPEASPADVDVAVESAQKQFESGDWARMAISERCATVERMLHGVLSRSEEVARLVTAEMGLPISQSLVIHEEWAQRLVTTAIQVARKISLWNRATSDSAAVQALTLRQPLGVVAAIAPWNSPFLQSLQKVVYPLLAGCSVVYKPSPESPLNSYILGDEMLRAGLPGGALSIIPGGRETGWRLVTHSGIEAVSFTGSTAVGREIGAHCGERMKHMSLELGGKSSAIVLDDVDLDISGPVIARGVFGNTGQVCIATTRILVSEKRAAEVTDRLVAEAGKLIMGDASDMKTTLGPLISSRQRERVLELVGSGVDEGARIVVGGGAPADQPRGWFFEPTIFDGVTNNMRIAQEEIFGPVATVMTYRSEQEAVDIANATQYGLHGAVFTLDPERALNFASKVRSGTFTVNGSLSNSEAPFSGFKASGVGVKFAEEGLLSYFLAKTINIPTAPGIEVLRGLLANHA